LRQLLLLESAHGNGVMLEASLDYYLTPAWSVGVATLLGLEHQHRQRDL
jgi:EamA domain-containing membrane protein RarD